MKLKWNHNATCDAFLAVRFKRLSLDGNFYHSFFLLFFILKSKIHFPSYFSQLRFHMYSPLILRTWETIKIFPPLRRSQQTWERARAIPDVKHKWAFLLAAHRYLYSSTLLKVSQEIPTLPPHSHFLFCHSLSSLSLPPCHLFLPALTLSVPFTPKSVGQCPLTTLMVFGLNLDSVNIVKYSEMYFEIIRNFPFCDKQIRRPTPVIAACYVRLPRALAE